MLKEKLQQDQIQALKSGDKEKLSILRYLIAQIKNKEIEKQTELNDTEVVEVIRKQVKELNEAKEAAQKANRQDLVTENQKQINIVSSYLPEELTDEELKKEVQKIIAENQEISKKNPKAIIGICIKLLKSKADPSRILKTLRSINKG